LDLKEENFGTLSWASCPSREAILDEAQLGLSKFNMMLIYRRHATIGS
jgi:hypothetical protein